MNKALFLDRDGIINVDHGYVYQQENFEFVEGIFELCTKAKANGFLIIIVTNQSGIGRGKYTENDFEKLCKWMTLEFQSRNIAIDDIFYCPHHPTSAKGEYLQSCYCRKPEPGMIIAAQKKHKIDVSQSIFIGDKKSDMLAANSAGVKHRLLVGDKNQCEGAPKTLFAENLYEIVLRFNGFEQ
ncbi:D-glycero-beta-D-manno-heptose 1,7-bisphosphate 7-phosphatase [Thalassotalea fusca]